MVDEGKDGKKKKCPDMLDLLFYLEQTGVGLPRNEMVLLNLSIRKLASEVPVENIRYSTRAAHWFTRRRAPKSYRVLLSVHVCHFSDLDSCATQLLGQDTRQIQKLLRGGGGTSGGRAGAKIRGETLVSNLQRASKFQRALAFPLIITDAIYELFNEKIIKQWTNTVVYNVICNIQCTTICSL